MLLAIALLAAGGYWLYRKYQPQLEARLDPPVVLEKYSIERPLMGTTFSITSYAADELSAQRAFEKAFAEGEAVNQACSDYLPDSDLTRLNSAAAGEWVEASPHLIKTIAYGLELADLTGGAYDPTVGTLTHLWRETKRAGALPDPAILAQARAAAGWEKVEVDQSRLLVRRLTEEVRLDLGGIAKGYAADQMLEVLAGQGMSSSLVAAGGDIRCGSRPPDKEGWAVGLKSRDGQLSALVTVSECSVSTSGDLHQFVEIDGVRYSHIVDPETGLGMSEPVLATVVAPSGLMSDPLATAACLRPEMVKGFSPHTDIHSRILMRTEAFVSTGFPEIQFIGAAEAAPATEPAPSASPAESGE
ncbi:MAG: FAD:protein FMN transferase [Verrucomicrobiota bacterium JB023]|nr:FAD:protein FMN transferase [Verrucomicrobiota bacterium JB023]